MIIYAPECEPEFERFGIEIPIKHHRSSAVVAGLRQRFPQMAEQMILPVPLAGLKTFDRRDLRYAHDRDYVRSLMDEDPSSALMKAFELKDAEGNYHRYNPQNARSELKDLRDLIISHASVTMLGAYIALEEDFCFFLGGGMHHAMSFGGRGFCLINDVVITLQKMIADYHLRTAWVIDTDAHKGDGTAEILQGQSERIRTLSIHMKEGWPLDDPDKAAPWHLPSFLDVEIAAGEESVYNERLKAGLAELKRCSKHRPDIAVVLAGQDPYVKDALPSSAPLALSAEQMLERDLMVFEFLRQEGIAQLWLLAGGYGEHAYEIPLQFLSHLMEHGLIPKSRAAVSDDEV